MKGWIICFRKRGNFGSEGNFASSSRQEADRELSKPWARSSVSKCHRRKSVVLWSLPRLKGRGSRMPTHPHGNTEPCHCQDVNHDSSVLSCCVCLFCIEKLIFADSDAVFIKEQKFECFQVQDTARTAEHHICHSNIFSRQKLRLHVQLNYSFFLSRSRQKFSLPDHIQVTGLQFHIHNTEPCHRQDVNHDQWVITPICCWSIYQCLFAPDWKKKCFWEKRVRAYEFECLGAHWNIGRAPFSAQISGFLCATFKMVGSNWHFISLPSYRTQPERPNKVISSLDRNSGSTCSRSSDLVRNSDRKRGRWLDWNFTYINNYMILIAFQIWHHRAHIIINQ